MDGSLRQRWHAPWQQQEPIDDSAYASKPHLEAVPFTEKPDSNPIDPIWLSSMNSIGSAHADHSCIA
jgi:hypothetical protein